jgi:hypothetical protein
MWHSNPSIPTRGIVFRAPQPPLHLEFRAGVALPSNGYLSLSPSTVRGDYYCDQTLGGAAGWLGVREIALGEEVNYRTTGRFTSGHTE